MGDRFRLEYAGFSTIRHAHAHMRSHARVLNALARGYLNMAGREFSPATELRTAALQWKSKRFLVAYGAGQNTAGPTNTLTLCRLAQLIG